MIESPTLFSRLACIVYETLLVTALFMLAAVLFIAVLGDATHGLMRYCFQVYLWLVAGVYFVYSWQRGATLAMQTWHIRLVSRGASVLTYQQLAVRYGIASVFFGLSFLWAFFDKEHLYLHDRLAGTRLIRERKSSR